MFGDDIGRVIGQHDAAGADADIVGARRDMGDGERGRSAGDAGEVMVLGNPDPLKAPLLGMDRNIAGPIQRGADIAVLGDTGEFENGKGDHEVGLAWGGKGDRYI